MARPNRPITGYSVARHAALTRDAGAYEATLDSDLAARKNSLIVPMLEAAFSGQDASYRPYAA